MKRVITIFSLCFSMTINYAQAEEEFYWVSTLSALANIRFASADAACEAAIDILGPIRGASTGHTSAYGGKEFALGFGRPAFSCYAIYISGPLPGMYIGLATTVRNGERCSIGTIYNPTTGDCVPNKDVGMPQCASRGGAPAGNPINTLRGYKFQTERDYDGGNNGLAITRFYHWDGGQGVWRFNAQPFLQLNPLVANGALANTVVLANRTDMSVISFDGDVSQGWSADSDIEEQLSALTDSNDEIIGWRLTLTDDSIEEYDADGRLTSLTRRNGQELTFIYDLDGNLDQVINQYNQTLSYDFDLEGRVSSVTDPDGQVYIYSYDVIGNLSSVTFPDSTENDSSDNPTKSYHYENAGFPQALTGITDETGERFATWTYDTQGRAISSEHAGGVEKFTVDYTYLDDATDPRVTVTNPLNKQTTYHFETINGRRLTTLIEGHASLNCPDTDRSNTYDANGFRDLAVDWNGVLTDFDHDERGLEVQRIEAVGTSEQRTISTTWHPDFRLPTEIIEPNKTTTFTYDTNSNLLSRTETNTNP